MKTMKRFLTTFFGLLVLIGTGCQVPEAPSPGGAEKGKLSVSLAGMAARTLLPAGMTLTPASYVLTATGPSGTNPITVTPADGSAHV